MNRKTAFGVVFVLAAVVFISPAVDARFIEHKEHHLGPTGLLGLLATGEQKYIDVVKEAIHDAKWAKPDIELSLQGTYKAWKWGYTNLLLCEYYLLTGDKYVLPAIRAYSVAIGQGRDAAGAGDGQGDRGVCRYAENDQRGRGRESRWKKENR